MIPNHGMKRKSAGNQHPIKPTNLISGTAKRFRGTTTVDGQTHTNERRTSLVSSVTQSSSKSMNSSRTETEMSEERRQLQHELQCQEALLVLMQKLQNNQQLALSSSSSSSSTATETNKQRTTSINTTKPAIPNGTATKPQSNPPIRSKPPHPNQYTVHRSTNQPNPIVPTSAIRVPSTGATPVTKHVAQKPSANHSVKNTNIPAEQQLLNAKLALRKQLEQTLLQIPSPKPSTCDLTYIPGMNGWSEFLTFIGLEQAASTLTDSIHRRSTVDILLRSPYVCAQCGTDWSVTWHDASSDCTDEKILCDRCRKTSQKKILKQDHSNRLRQAFIQALQQERELDAKFQQQQLTSPVKPSPAHHKHSPKASATKVHSNSTSHHHHHHRRVKNNSSKTHPTNPFPFEAFAGLQTNEQLEFLQKHFLSNMIPFAMANQVAATLTRKSTPQQQAFAASFPAMAASLLQQQNPAQYLLDMIPQPQSAKQQQHRSK